MTVFAWIVGVCIVLFTVRRFCLWAASCLQPRAIAPDRSHPVAVLVAARNESSVLGRLLSAIDRLDYPKRLLHIVLVSDASEDSTVSLMRAWADGKPQVKVLDLPHRHGKAKALQCALAAAPPTSLVAVFDADTEPAPDALAWLAG
jgi:cellulose synthase/poly-beta-1,6-N-acetylglucosamine synthase-like glycosyltransferase